MQLFNSFPPADAAVEYLKNVDYKKHAHNLLIGILFVAAFVYVLSQKIRQWWQNGGKESTIQSLQKVRNILQVCYSWIVNQAIPEVKNAHQEIQNSYKNAVQYVQSWIALVTVA